jgi:hypothetical protein
MCKSFINRCPYPDSNNARPALAISEQRILLIPNRFSSSRDRSASNVVGVTKHEESLPSPSYGQYLNKDHTNCRANENRKTATADDSIVAEAEDVSSQSRSFKKTALEVEIDLLESDFKNLQYDLYQNQIDIVHLRVNVMTTMMLCKAAATPIQQSTQHIMDPACLTTRKKQVRFMPHHTFQIPACI